MGKNELRNFSYNIKNKVKNTTVFLTFKNTELLQIRVPLLLGLFSKRHLKNPLERDS